MQSSWFIGQNRAFIVRCLSRIAGMSFAAVVEVQHRLSFWTKPNILFMVTMEMSFLCLTLEGPYVSRKDSQTSGMGIVGAQGPHWGGSPCFITSGPRMDPAFCISLCLI